MKFKTSFVLAAALAAALPAVSTAATAPEPAATISVKLADTRAALRDLWIGHVFWVRNVVEARFDNNDAAAAAAERQVVANAHAIAGAIEPFYGKAAGDKLTAELRQHILIAADLVAAAKAGDQAKLADAQARWEQNANGIASVLNSVNPRFWKLATMKAEMHLHLALTTEEAVARLNADWKADVAAYDRIHRHILHMSDLLSAGLVKQFPKRFR